MATRSETLDRLAAVLSSRRSRERRVSPLAATVVTALFTAGLAQARSEGADATEPARREISLQPGKERKVALRLKESEEDVITILTGETALPVDPPLRPLDASPRGEAGR